MRLSFQQLAVDKSALLRSML